MTLDPGVVEAAAALVPDQGRTLLGIAGMPGAGKSTLAVELVAGLEAGHGPGWAAYVPMDGFHLADVRLAALGLADRKGAPETFDVDGYAALLRRVRTLGHRPVYAPGFERDLEQPIAAAVVVPPSTRLVVTEGNYLLLRDPAWRAVRAELDAVWRIDGDDAVRRERLVARHVAHGKEPAAARSWVERVDDANAREIRDSSDLPDAVVLSSESGWLWRRIDGSTE